MVQTQLGHACYATITHLCSRRPSRGSVALQPTNNTPAAQGCMNSDPSASVSHKQNNEVQLYLKQVLKNWTCIKHLWFLSYSYGR